MHMQSCENCIAALKKARDACSSQLDSSALENLKAAIKDLEMALELRANAEEVAKLRLRSLQVLAALVSILTNVGKWLER